MALTFPTPYCPLPSAIHPDVTTAHNASMQWACDFRLVESDTQSYWDLEAAQFAQLAGLGYPLISIKDLELASLWNIWVFLVDDVLENLAISSQPDHLSRYGSYLLEVIHRATIPTQEQPLAQALHNICERVSDRGGTAWLRRFTLGIKHYLQGNYWEAVNRQQNVVPDVTTYLKMRYFTGGACTVFDLVAITADIDPQSEFLEHIYIQELARMASNHICWINDIISLEKEIRHNNPNNLVLVLQQQEHLSLQEAVNRAMEMCNAEMRAFLQLEAQLPSLGAIENHQMHQYVQGLRTWMRGSLDWHFTTHRYHVLTHTA